MGKSTSDTFRDLLGGITDDFKEAFDDIIDYDDHGRRRGGRERRRDDHWRHREDDGHRHDRDRDPWWRQREDDGHRHDRDRDRDRWRGQGGGRRAVEDDGYDRGDGFPPRASAGLPRQSRRGRRSEQEDLKETVEALRSELSTFVAALRETSAAHRSVAGEEPGRT